MIVRGLTLQGTRYQHWFCRGGRCRALRDRPVFGLFALPSGRHRIGILGERLNERDTAIGII